MKTNNQLTKAQLVVFNAIRKFEPLHITDIARTIKRHPTTVAHHIKTLLKRKVVTTKYGG
jgi:DNA-binding MarR family transcriptional regulator